jgi:c-di-GMP-binding flagellar brake protein YcgR
MTKQTQSSDSLIGPSFNVGNKVQVVLKSSAGQEPLSTTLLGYSEKQFLLLKLPVAANGVPITVYGGETISVRVFTGISVVVFDAKALRCEFHPFYCPYLTYPAEVRTHTLRNSIRVLADLPCVVKGGSREALGTLVNLSTSGALIQSPANGSAVGERINLRFALKSQLDIAANDLDLQAVVRSVNPVMDQNEDILKYGVEFADLGAADQLALQNYVYEVLLSDRKRVV